MRAFLAVPVGPPAHDALAARIESLRVRVAGVRWVDTATTHVTLHFFSELPAEQVGSVVAAVRPIAARQAPFTLQPVRFGSFPGGPRARVLWVGLDGQADVLAGNAQYWLGETYYAQSDYKNAAIAFAEGYQKYPKSSKAPDNLLKLGMSLGQTGRKADACTAFKQLNAQFPNASGAIKDRTARAQQRYGC